MAIIEVEHVVKDYITVVKKPGIHAALKSLLFPEKKTVRAVDDISFTIEPGEIIGYIGPNGAGKSTMIKMLSGILHPTSGEIRVCGISPQQNRKAVVQNLGVVFGQRTQLYWDLQLRESFELLRRIYRVDAKTFRENMEMLQDILGLEDFIGRPVRQLSLGQRMRGDLAAAMLHSPSILFLDEPTIGLDAEAKHAIRNFIREINKARKVTVILTTHDLDDIEKLCSRVIVVNRGKIVEDGPIGAIVNKLTPMRLLEIELKEPASVRPHPAAEIVRHDGLHVSYRFDKNRISASDLIADLSKQLPIRDLSVKDPAIEDALREIYKEKELVSRGA
ncbi:MAG: sugar ABC transporter ATP-binding protein [Chlorobi bacterium NICIL-2]|nr:MAG: sugar ABC transporter ATP-binding protein [Chlorobi bacterium NICIL-2]